ncbi:MAG: biopolymer transporter ExbD [Gammaproteobacteria bacterium]|nr:biopolymer transporter ExbD [Gammaproteobacteria bacterium]
MKPRWQRKARRDAHTVDVTAFLSLMVILVPFLLVTAVFSRMTILEVQPAGGEGDGETDPDPLQLQVTVRRDVIEVDYFEEAGQPQSVNISRSTDAQALDSLATLAGELKTRYPDSLEATVLLEPQVAYEVLVDVLDVLRVKLQPQDDVTRKLELFPLIALGPVPVAVPLRQGTQ